MSLKEGSMAAQEGEEVHQGEASSSSSPQGISFVKSIDRKARSYLKTLERSLSFSMTESKGEDPSTMTIEFLRTRLQAQRAEFKAEKQRSQLLAKKVLELEQRLSFEIEQRRKAEGNNMQLIPSNYRGGHPSSRLKHAHSYNEGDFIDFKLKDKVSGEDNSLVWCPEVFGHEGHPDGDGVFLVSPSPLWRRQESLRRERQQKIDQHVISQFKESSDAASESDKESFTSTHRDKPCEAISCGELALSMEELEAIADRDSAKFQIDRQASALYDADKSLRFDCSRQHTHASPIDSCCQNYQVKLSQNPVHPHAKTVSSNFLLQRGMHASCVESYAKRPSKFTNLPPTSKSVWVGHDKILKYIAPHSNTVKTMQEEANLEKLLNDESRSKYMKNILYPEGVTDYEISTYRRSSQQPHTQKSNTTLKTCRSFSDVETRYAGKLLIHRMSLDGSLDRLQKVGKDGKSAKF